MRQCRWQRGAVHRLEGVKDFGYIKFFGSRKYEELIDWLGSSMIASASSGEATHKELKHAYAYTNKQGGAAMKQVSPTQHPDLQHVRDGSHMWLPEVHL